jgi:exodeoxyribonuclease V gamma subunit
MRVYRSNRVELLADALAEVVAEPARGPFDPETIVVHSRAMAVWLTMRLSERFGVWAGGDFPFPRNFVHRIFDAALGERASGLAAWEAERLAWAISAELPRHLRDAAFDPLARFLDADPRPHGRFELSLRIAEIFDQYAVFRPQMVLDWQRGEGDDWQAILWRALVLRLGDGHLASLAQSLFHAIEGGRLDTSALPARVAVFGVSTLPPFFLQVLRAIGTRLPVHLFVLSPSREYWAEIRSQREALRAARRDPDRVAPPALVDEGNPLLASFGAVGRDFQRVLEAEVDYEEPVPPRYAADEETTMLGRLQADVLALRRRGRRRGDDAARVGPAPLPAAVLDPSDDSIRVHVCHTPMREVEVLHDQILDLVHERGVEPHEIVVLTPDIATYGPLVEAAFQRDRSDPRFVPHAIADRAARAMSPVLEALLRVLALVGGRSTASEVLDLLALHVVRERFEIGADEHDRIAEWVVDVGIRWGVDAAHRQAHGQPRYEENTWQFGLSRLLLGYALPGRGRDTFAGTLPFDEIEGTDALVLGKLVEFCTALFQRLDDLARPRALPAWREAIARTLEALVAADTDSAWEHRQILAALDELVADGAAAGFEDVVELATVRERLEHRLDSDRPAAGFLSGGVTFCALLPMRSLPFRVVALLGMNDGAFPRATKSVGFDRIAEAPRPGDRSRRGDDRYLFLEALLSARERIVITHVGQSVQDNAALPPSVVVSELLDVLAESFVAPEHADASGIDPAERAEAVHRHVIVRHPMQPFSPRYFGSESDPRIYSYALSWHEGARALARGHDATVHAPLFCGPLPPPGTSRDLPLDQLVRFFAQPTAQLLKRRLGINLDDYSRDASDREPMELDGLEEWAAGQAVLEHRLERMPLYRSLELLRARGVLPLGVPGRCRFDQIVATADPIAAVATAVRGEHREPDLDVDLLLGDTRLVGRIGDRFSRATLLAQFAKIGAKHQLAAWIRHLVACVCAPDVPRVTAIVGRSDGSTGAQLCQLQPVEDPEPHLRALVDLYWAGQREPLLLFPRSSLAYAEALPKGPAEAMVAARKHWTDRLNAEGRDPQLRRVFGDLDPLQPGFSLLAGETTAGDFPTLATRVFGPLIAHRQEVGR